MLDIYQTSTTTHAVMGESGNVLGWIKRQPSSTMYAFYLKGQKLPFKRRIPTLTQAKNLALKHPQVWENKPINWKTVLNSAVTWLGITYLLFAFFSYFAN